jgi:hypothetical protein
MPGWLGIVMARCPIFPSLVLGSRGRETMPFLLTDTTVAVIARSFQRIFPFPLPSVTQTLPSDAVKVTTAETLSRCDARIFSRPPLT